MIYEIKERPRVIYESITQQLVVIDETGKEYHIRKWEDSKGSGYYILNEERVWEDFYPNEELEDFLGLI